MMNFVDKLGAYFLIIKTCSIVPSSVIATVTLVQQSALMPLARDGDIISLLIPPERRVIYQIPTMP
jgi:hypothetical protein